MVITGISSREYKLEILLIYTTFGSKARLIMVLYFSANGFQFIAFMGSVFVGLKASFYRAKGLNF